MLTQLFPKRHSRYTTSQAAHWLEAFSGWLIARGYAAKPAQLHVWRLKKVLERHRPVPATGMFSARTLPRMFSRQKRVWSYQATHHAFHRFLSERGAITATTRPGRFSELLSAYRRHLTELRGLAPSTTDQHLSTVMEFLSQSAVKRIHAPVRAEPVATLHVLGSPREQQLAEAETGNEDIRFADLAGGKLDPLDRIACIVDFDALARAELARRHIGLPVLRELLALCGARKTPRQVVPNPGNWVGLNGGNRAHFAALTVCA